MVGRQRWSSTLWHTRVDTLGPSKDHCDLETMFLTVFNKKEHLYVLKQRTFI